jgi:glycosyltransferase involved in cell wall biosynthesis
MTRRLFLTADAVGGVWQYATELTRALAPLGYQVTVALLGPPPSPAQRGALDGATLVETGLALDWVAADAATVLETGAAIARLAEAHRADIVQLNQPALAAGGAFAMPLVAVAHSCVGTWWRAVRGDAPEPADFAWQTALMQRGLAQADAIVAPSHAFAAALQARYALPAAPLAVHNGRSPICTSPGPIHDFAFTAGRLWDQGKGIATLDRAAARLSVPFKAAGPLTGPNRQSIEVANLYAPGPLSDGAIADCLCARPVFVSAARYEPFGLAVLEAALAGCPLVLADTPVFRELWDGAALFVDAEDDAGFAAAIERIVGDVPLRIAQGDLARARAARFTPTRMAAGMDAVFTCILDGRAQRAAA